MHAQIFWPVACSSCLRKGLWFQWNIKFRFPFVPFILPFPPQMSTSSLRPFCSKPPHFIRALQLRWWRITICNICKRKSGLNEEQRRLQVRNCHSICIKLKLIAGLLCSCSVFTAGQVPGLIWLSWLISCPHWAHLLLPFCPNPPIRHSQQYGSGQNASHATSN